MLSRVEHDKSFRTARLGHANARDSPIPVYDIRQALLYYDQTLLFSNCLGSRKLCPQTIVNQLEETCLGQCDRIPDVVARNMTAILMESI